MRIRDVVFPEGTFQRKFVRKIVNKIRERGSVKYSKWIKYNEPTLKELNEQRKTQFSYNPKISLIVPMYNTPYNFFKELVDCLINQTYANWELCLADGSNVENEKLKEIYMSDNRIKYKFLGENKGISGNTNECIKMATGDFIAFLDHDDLLPIFSLYEIVKCINENPNVEFIYTDEDKITKINKPRFCPNFKPDFSLDYIRSNNYICHFCVYKKELMQKVGGVRSKYDGAQDHDIILRSFENVKDIKNIVHIHKILYHWRVHSNSTSQAENETKTYAFNAGKMAIQDHLERMGLQGEIEKGVGIGTYRVKYKFNGNPKVSIIIPNKDEKETLKKCIESILNKTTYLNYEILIIENNSETKEIFDYYKELSKNEKIKVIEYKEKGFNYSKIINFGVRNSTGEYILQLNNDIEVKTNDWLEDMLGFAAREEIGAVGVKLIYPNNKIQHAGVVFGVHRVAEHLFKGLHINSHGYFERENIIQNLNAVTGACIMSRKSIYEEVGYMDETFPVAFNDLDFCLKIRNKGKLIAYDPFVTLIHYESKTRGYEDTPEKIMRLEGEIQRLREKWKEFFEKGDCYYNKNFSLNSSHCKIRKKPI